MRVCGILCALILAAAGSVWSGEIYQSNSIWMKLEQIDQIPSEGYAVKVTEQTDSRQVLEGYQDGSRAVRVIRERDGRVITETREDAKEDRRTIRTYRGALLISEETITPEERELTEFEYSASGELETVRSWTDDVLDQEQLFFRRNDGSLRSVYRFVGDQFLQMMTVRDGGFTVGTEDQTVTESWEDDRYIREIYREDELTYRREEGSDYLLEHDYREDTSLEQRFSDGELILKRRISGDHSTETSYSYDNQGRLTEEQFKEITPQREVTRKTAYAYHQEGWLEQTSRYVNNELRERAFHDRDGNLLQREIYRGGRKLLTYTYD